MYVPQVWNFELDTIRSVNDFFGFFQKYNVCEKNVEKLVTEIQFSNFK